MTGKLFFSGYYGMKNYGDDLFAITCALASKRYWNVDAQVICPPLEGIEGSCYVSKRLEERYASVGRVGQVVRAAVKGKALLQSDILVLGGGSTVSPVPPKLFEAYSRLPFRRKKLAGLGLSVEPVSDKRIEGKIERFLDSFEFLSLRDTASYEYVSSLNVRCKTIMARDLVGVLPAIVDTPKETIAPGREVLGLAPCNYERYSGGNLSLERQRNQAIIEGVIKYAKRHSARVAIYSLNNHPVFGDDPLAESYEAKLRAEGIDCCVIHNRERGALNVWRSISACDAFLSVRLHGAITAYLNKVPFALVEYHKKCTEFLNDVGIAQSCRVTENSSAEIFRILENLRGAWACDLDAQVYCKDAQRSFTEAYELFL